MLNSQLFGLFRYSLDRKEEKLKACFSTRGDGKIPRKKGFWVEDWDSKHYKEHGLLQKEAVFKILKKFPLNGTEKVLDLGCGDGKATMAIVEKVPEGQVVGIDRSPNMIQEAKSVWAHIPNLSFKMMDAADFSFTQKFDLITSFFALHWVVDHAPVLKCAAASLKEGGRILFYFLTGGNPLVGEVFEKEPWKTALEKREKIVGKFPVKDVAFYRDLLQKHNFKEKTVENRPFSFFFPNVEALAGFFMTWVPTYLGLPKEESEKVSMELAENHARHQKRRENIEHTLSMLYVEAFI